MAPEKGAPHLQPPLLLPCRPPTFCIALLKHELSPKRLRHRRGTRGCQRGGPFTLYTIFTHLRDGRPYLLCDEMLSLTAPHIYLFPSAAPVFAKRERALRHVLDAISTPSTTRYWFVLLCEYPLGSGPGVREGMTSAAKVKQSKNEENPEIIRGRRTKHPTWALGVDHFFITSVN